MRPILEVFLYGTGAVLFFVAAGLLLSEGSPSRTASMAASQPVAQLPAPPAPAAPPANPELESAQAKLEKAPDDVALAAAVAHGLMGQEKLDEAERLTRHALARDPFHTEHRIHAEMLRGMRGEAQQALDGLERLGRVHPDGAEAWLLAGGLALELGELRRALGDFEAYKAEVPEGEVPPRLGEVVAQLRAQLAEDAGASAR